MPVSVVWFKRDLRVSDNRALTEASKSPHPVICLFNLEPERLERNDVSGIHIEWELDCARELGKSLGELGGKLLFNFGNVVGKLSEIHAQYEISSIFSHEETGLNWSWNRDKSVTKWCKQNSVSFTEYPTNGVIRGLRSRDNWKSKRDARVVSQLINPPLVIKSPKDLKSDIIPESKDIGIESRMLVDRPNPGEKAAISVLFSFLDERGRKYRSGMSSPITGQQACSRLSPYISVGCITIRQILYYTRRKQKKVKINPRSAENRGWTSSLSSFQSRLAWHCHFIQRLEFESTMDEIAINPELDEHLQRVQDKDRYQAWAKGQTGWPFFDACMRYLTATGWINFRMRAMLQSVASYTLWLPWQDTGMHLARLFLDYEPGIHWSQVHMQSGVTGINSVRAYSVRKQSEDQDSDGDFIREWVEELGSVPTEFIHEPWLMNLEQQELYNCIIGKDYPKPIVDEKSSRKEGVSKSYSAKGKPDVRKRSSLVYEIHGSRKRRN
jgi:deoxyribodipyrimidine photo-lyase